LLISNNHQVQFFQKSYFYESLIEVDKYKQRKKKQYVEVNMNKVVIKFLQGSVITQTMLSGLAIHPPVTNVL